MNKHFLALLLFSSPSVFAVGPAIEIEPRRTTIETEGPIARKLFRAMDHMGLQKNLVSGGDKFFTATDVMCIEHTNAAYTPPKPPTFDCTFNGDPRGGESNKETLKIAGKFAKEFFRALEANGLTKDCGMGSCGIPAFEVTATRKGFDTSAQIITDSGHAK